MRCVRRGGHRKDFARWYGDKYTLTEPGADQKPEQTVITNEAWQARQLAAHLLGDDADTELVPAKTNRTPGKVTALNAFNIPSTPTIDADPKPKACPLCSGFAILFDTNPSVACSVCGCEVWGETIDEALARWKTRPGDGSEASE